MTPEQILAGLRDIHLPEGDSEALGGTLVAWPLVFVALSMLGLAWLTWRRRTIWRREVARDLARIERSAAETEPSEAWASLALLLRRFAIQRGGRSDVAGLSGEAWLARLDQLFGDDLFTKGPGRGLVTFPYRSLKRGELPEDDAADMADDLQATITALRKQLPRQGLLG